MTRDSFGYTHGDVGSKPSSSLDFAQNERPNAQNFDWFWYNAVEAINGHASEFGRLDSDDDGVVDAAETLRTEGTAAVIRDTTNSQDLLVANEGGPFDLSGAGQDLRLSTGQSIEDGSGTDRIRLLGGETRIVDDAGNNIIQGISTSDTRINAYSAQPIVLRDQEGGFTAVQYDTDPSAGVLRTPNAGMRVESNGNKSSGEGLEFRYNPSTPEASVLSFDQDGSGDSRYKKLNILGGDVNIESHTGLIDLSSEAADLRLDTNQKIEDGGGEPRLTLSSTRTLFHDETGSGRLAIDGRTIDTSVGNGSDLRLATGQDIEDGSATGRFTLGDSRTSVKDDQGRIALDSGVSNSWTALRAYSDQSVVLWDSQAGQIAARYNSVSGGTGAVEMRNANLDFDQKNGIKNLGWLSFRTDNQATISIPGDGTTNYQIRYRDPAVGTNIFQISDEGIAMSGGGNKHVFGINKGRNYGIQGPKDGGTDHTAIWQDGNGNLYAQNNAGQSTKLI